MPAPDLARDLLPPQQRLTEADYALRQLRNALESLALSLPADLRASLAEEVDEVGKIITRTDAVARRLRKLPTKETP